MEPSEVSITRAHIAVLSEGFDSFEAPTKTLFGSMYIHHFEQSG